MSKSSECQTYPLLKAAVDLRPLVIAVADQVENDRQLTSPVVDALAQAGIFRALVPTALGGAELDPATYARVIEVIFRADGSTGWCVLAGSFRGVTAGFLPENVARRIFIDDPRANVGAVIHAGGRAIVVEGDYRVTGRWTFGSGCMHATIQGGWCVVYDGDSPRLDPSGVPETILEDFPRNDFQVVDTWRVTGLRGTGSHDFTVADAFVPDAMTMPGNPFNWVPPTFRPTLPVGHSPQAVDLMWEAAGASAISTSTGLDRCFRDAHSTRQHRAITPDNYRWAGQARLGMTPDVLPQGPGPWSKHGLAGHYRIMSRADAQAMLSWISIDPIVDRKVVEAWVERDHLGVLQQLGTVPGSR